MASADIYAHCHIQAIKFVEQHHSLNTALQSQPLCMSVACGDLTTEDVPPCRRAHLNRHTDKELLHLKIYLLKIAKMDSLASLKHKRWERHIADELRSLQQ